MKISDSQLIEKYANDLRALYIQDIPTQIIKEKLNISHHHLYRLRKVLRLDEKWKKLGLPETFSSQTIQVIYGSLLGDGSLVRPGGEKYYSFTTGHSPKQLDYLTYKWNMLSEIKPKPITTSAISSTYPFSRFATFGHPIFSALREQLYPQNRKTVSLNFLSQLEPLGIAIWFMDDGSHLNHYGLSFSTCSFSMTEHLVMQDFFVNKYKIKPHISNSKYLRLNFCSKEAKKLRDLISPHVIPSMQYKLQLVENIGAGRLLDAITFENFTQDHNNGLTYRQLANKYGLTYTQAYHMTQVRIRNKYKNYRYP